MYIATQIVKYLVFTQSFRYAESVFTLTVYLERLSFEITDTLPEW